jgi:hypothetical protein
VESVDDRHSLPEFIRRGMLAHCNGSTRKDFPLCTWHQSPRCVINYRREHSTKLMLSFRASSRKSGDSLRD